MATRDKTLETISATGLVAVIRAKDSDQLVEVAGALFEGGCKAIEVTMTTPNALDVISSTVRALGGKDVVIGAGTVLDAETARAVMLAGAEFVVSPVLDLETVQLCRRYDKLVMPGTFSPTEILTAWQAGADLVKLFPATAVGPRYIKDIHGPLPQVKLVPTGGVTAENAGDFIMAGAEAVAAGGALVKKELLAKRDFAGISKQAATFIQNIQRARNGQ